MVPWLVNVGTLLVPLSTPTPTPEMVPVLVMVQSSPFTVSTVPVTEEETVGGQLVAWAARGVKKTAAIGNRETLPSRAMRMGKPARGGFGCRVFPTRKSPCHMPALLCSACRCGIV